MSDTYSMHDIRAVSAKPKIVLDKWISLGLVKTEHNPTPPTPREFTLKEAIQLCAIAEITRFKYGQADASEHVAEQVARYVQHLHGFKDDAAVLVIWEGPVNVGTKDNPIWFRGGHDAQFFSDIVRPQGLADMIRDPVKCRLMAINLDDIERRLMQARTERTSKD